MSSVSTAMCLKGHDKVVDIVNVVLLADHSHKKASEFEVGAGAANNQRWAAVEMRSKPQRIVQFMRHDRVCDDVQTKVPSTE